MSLHSEAGEKLETSVCNPLFFVTPSSRAPALTITSGHLSIKRTKEGCVCVCVCVCVGEGGGGEKQSKIRLTKWFCFSCRCCVYPEK